jgi:chemotaxis protein methyltransferase CheR
VTWTHPAYEAIARQLVQRAGLNFTPHRRDSAELGIRRAMARAGVTDLDRYHHRIVTDDSALDDLVAELAVGETYFFREPAQFDFLRRAVLPEVRRRRGAGHVIRAWSAGCASGEEAYSLAILFEQEGLGDRARLLATDVSRPALARARRAIYGPWSLRGEEATPVRPFLRRHGPHHVLDETIRRRVTFEHLNLALAVYPSPATGTWGMDLILCRNVLIYFDPETVRGVARRLYESLAPGGWLLTASSDPPLGGAAPYETVLTDAGVFYRRPEEQGPVGPGQGHVNRGTENREPRTGNREPGTGNEEEGTVPPPSFSVLGSTVEMISAPDPLAAARDALARGEYGRAADMTRDLREDAAAGALHVRALANLDPAEAERACALAAARHLLSPELHYLHAVLLMGLGREGDAVRAVRRALYLDPALAVAHFTLGTLLVRLGDRAGARRAYRNAADLCAGRPPAEVVPLSEGERNGRLAEAAAAQAALLEATGEVSTP